MITVLRWSKGPNRKSAGVQKCCSAGAHLQAQDSGITKGRGIEGRSGRMAEGRKDGVAKCGGAGVRERWSAGAWGSGGAKERNLRSAGAQERPQNIGIEKGAKAKSRKGRRTQVRWCKRAGAQERALKSGILKFGGSGDVEDKEDFKDTSGVGGVEDVCDMRQVMITRRVRYAEDVDISFSETGLTNFMTRRKVCLHHDRRKNRVPKTYEIWIKGPANVAGDATVQITVLMRTMRATGIALTV